MRLRYWDHLGGFHRWRLGVAAGFVSPQGDLQFSLQLAILTRQVARQFSSSTFFETSWWPESIDYQIYIYIINVIYIYTFCCLIPLKQSWRNRCCQPPSESDQPWSRPCQTRSSRGSTWCFWPFWDSMVCWCWAAALPTLRWRLLQPSSRSRGGYTPKKRECFKSEEVSRCRWYGTSHILVCSQNFWRNTSSHWVDWRRVHQPFWCCGQCPQSRPWSWWPCWDPSGRSWRPTFQMP